VPARHGTLGAREHGELDVPSEQRSVALDVIEAADPEHGFESEGLEKVRREGFELYVLRRGFHHCVSRGSGIDHVVVDETLKLA